MKQTTSNALFKEQKKIKVKRKLSPEPQKEAFFIYKENEILFSHKSSLELLLNIIKRNQLALFSEFSGDEKNTLILKQRLSLLKDKFNLLLKEKNKKIRELEEKNQKLKNEGVEKLFLTYETVEEKKDKNIIEKNRIYPSELDKIKLLNFEIENKIKKIEFLIEKKEKMANQKISEENQDYEIYCGNENKKNEKAQELFTNHMRKASEEFDEMSAQSERNEIEKGLIKNQINFLKKRKEEKMRFGKSLSSENVFAKNLKNQNTEPNDNNGINEKNNNEYLLTEDNLKKQRCFSLEQLNKYTIFNEDNNEEEKESFHSSLYTDNLSGEDSFVLDIEEDKDDKIASSNISNDNINTEYNSEKEMTNNFKNINFVNEKINQCDNFIFANISDED